MLRLIFLFTLTLALSLFPLSSLALRHPSGEIRGVWLTNIDSEVLFEAKPLTNAINTLSEHHFNTLYPTVWNWGHTLYPSQVTPQVTGYTLDPTEGLENRDILQEIIIQGHRKKMKVIPWFEFGFMAPADSELAKRHPDWLTLDYQKRPIWLEGNVHQRVWLNPLNPEVQQFISDLVGEIVKNYAVDGIQFDDHFGYPANFGYDSDTIRLYQAEHQGKLPPAPPDTLNPNQSCIVNDSDWQEWTQWRSQKITDYLEILFAQIKKANPKAIVSVSPNPQPFSTNCYLADWYSWERKGLVEQLVVQVYRDNMDSFNRELQQKNLNTAKTHIPVAIGILAGLKGRPIPMQLIEQQVNLTRDQDFAGVSFFFYESLWNLAEESPQDRQAMFKSLFPSPVAPRSISHQ